MCAVGQLCGEDRLSCRSIRLPDVQFQINAPCPDASSVQRFWTVGCADEHDIALSRVLQVIEELADDFDSSSCAFSLPLRLLRTESISSMKTTAPPSCAAIFCASLSRVLTFAVDSLIHFDWISAPLTWTNGSPSSVANALILYVFPTPGGPYRITPGGETPRSLALSGFSNGVMTSVRSFCFTSVKPPRLSKDTPVCV